MRRVDKILVNFCWKCLHHVKIKPSELKEEICTRKPCWYDEAYNIKDKIYYRKDSERGGFPTHNK